MRSTKMAADRSGGNEGKDGGWIILFFIYSVLFLVLFYFSLGIFEIF